MIRPSLERSLQWVAGLLVLLAVSAGALGRSLVRIIYAAPEGTAVSGLIAGGSRERGLDEYLALLTPLTTTVSVWAMVLAVVVGLMALKPSRFATHTTRLSPYVVLSAVYFLAWGLLLLSAPGVYWDDWSFYGQPLSETYRLHSEGGRPLNNLYDLFVRGIGASGLSTLSLAIHLLVGLGFFRVLEQGGHGTRGERLIASAILLAAPLNAARQTYAVFQYTFALGLLVTSWFLLTRRTDGPDRREIRLVAPLLLLASFTPSIAMYSYVVVAHVAMVQWKRTHSVGRILILLPLLPIPALVLVIDQFVLVPSGAMEEYNVVDISVLVAWSILLFALTAAVGVVGFLRYRRPTWQPGLMAVLLPILLGSLLIVMALLPYAVVGRTPMPRLPPFGFMGTRHELLLGFGLAVFVVGLLRVLRRGVGAHITSVFAGVLIASFVLQSAVISLSYWVEYEKQKQFMAYVAELSDPDVITRSRVVLLDDLTVDCNALTRNIRPDEWEAQIRLMQPAFLGRVELASADDSGVHNPDLVVILRNERGGCQLDSGLLPLWSMAGLPRLVRLPKLVVLPPQIEVQVLVVEEALRHTGR